MNKSKRSRKIWQLATVFAGLLLLGLGWHMLTWTDDQANAYNMGMQAYRTNNIPEALKQFDVSLAVYKRRSDPEWWERFVYPQADRELAALAEFQKAKALLRIKDGKKAVEAFKESLRLNPGNQYEDLRGFEHLSDAEILQLVEAALVTKYDLELLFKNNQQLAQQQGKGEGEPQPGDQPKKAKPGDEESPGRLPGQGTKNDI